MSGMLSPRLSQLTPGIFLRFPKSTTCARRLLLQRHVLGLDTSAHRPNCDVRRLTTSTPSRAALTPQLSSRPTVVLATPSLGDLRNEELDIEFIPLEQVNIVITDRAAEQLRSIASRENNTDAALRISVESGGCHGYQYKMELATSRSPDDYQFTHPTTKPANILIDAVSLSLLNGSTIDFATELIGSSFRVNDNPQAKGSGCGCGVSWELKD